MRFASLLLVSAVVVVLSQNALAQRRNFGLGFMLGEPTGFSAKLWTSRTNAFDFGLGWTTFEKKRDKYSRIHFHVDYLWHSFKAIKSTEQFPLYYGLGGRYRDDKWDEGSLAIRGVLGIAWMPRETPIDIFLEVAPSMEITPSTEFDLDAAIGARYYF